MTALNFPTGPTTGQTYSVSPTTWTWNGTRWTVNAPTVTGPAGIAVQDTAPSSTSVLWLDTSVAGVMGQGPTGPTGSGITGPTGPASTVTGPTGWTGPSVTGPTGPADANSLTGATLASNVLYSSLTSLGTLASVTTTGTISADGTGGITTSQTTFPLINTTAQTINAFGAATTLNIGYSSTTASNTTNFLTAAQQSGTTKTINIATGSAVGSTTAINLGSTSGTSTVTVNGTLVGSATSQDLFNTTATTLNIGGAATTLSLGASSGTTTINNNLSLASGKTISTTGSITSNNTTAFIAGDNAISNIALQMPHEGAIRNLYNGSTNMYFDVSIGGTTQGAFQFRSSSGYTNVLTMSSTGVTFNTDATITARTPSLARTAFNAAIDTEITVDEMRFRISNSGGIFPQVIGNSSSRNLAWTGVGAISGSAVTQVGSTGTIVSSSAWTTLYNAHGMDSAGDTVTVTLQDKALSRIYRITFMRSDNGSTTGYNIIGERLL